MSSSLCTQDPSAITVLVAKSENQHCSKKFVLQEDGSVKSEQYPLITVWNVDSYRVSDPDSLHETIVKLARRRNAMAIFGALSDDDDPRALNAGVYRRYKSKPNRPADFTDYGREWVAIDIDDLEAPKSMTSHHPQKLAEWARAQMPKRFRSASCTYQFTSSYRTSKGANYLRLRLWFLVDRPVKSLEWRAYWKGEDCPWVDTALYNPVQPIYTAHPMFDGVKAPMKISDRIGFIPGASAVEMGDIHTKIAEAAERAAEEGKVLEYDPGFEPNMEEVHVAMHRILNQKTTGARHHHALGAACELVGLGCPGDRITAFVEKIISNQGREANPGEASDIVEEAVRKFRAGELKVTRPPMASILSPLDEDIDDEEMIVDVLDSEIESMVGYGASIFGNAKAYLKRNHESGGYLYCNQTDWEWTSTHWKQMGKTALRSRIVKDAEMAARSAESVAETIRSIEEQENLKMPGWISDPDREPVPMAVFENGMICLEDLIFDEDAVVEDHDQDFFNAVVLPFKYDAKAKCPQWLKFVDDCFETDEEKREFRKMFGYMLSQRNDLQKFFLLQGPKRSGKGVTLAVLSSLMGEENIAAPMLTSLADEFALQPLVGKPAIMIDEANSSLNASGQERVVDLIKAVTGNSPLQINRKKKDHLQRVRLPGRFVLACNRLPTFLDPSGAVTTRMIPFVYYRCFEGKEDLYLEQKLKTELPGIFNWAVQGLRDLMSDNRFILQPKAITLLETAKRASAPIFAFIQDAVDQTGAIPKEDLYSAYSMWCTKNGHKAVSNNKFQAEITQSFPKVEVKQRREYGRKRCYIGLKLNEEWDEAMNPKDEFDPVDDSTT